MLIYCICTQYLVGPPLEWITASMRRGMEVISLWHCSGVMEAKVALISAFRSNALLDLVSFIFLLTIPHRFSMGFRSSEFAGQSSTPTPWSFNQLLVPLAVWAGAKSCWKIKSASPESLSAKGSMKCSKISWYTAVLTVDFRKHSGPTPADDMAAQIMTDCGNFTLDFKQHGSCALLGGCSARLTNKLQMVQNAAARVLTRTRKYDHISPDLSTLHWLPIKHRIDFKILLKVINKILKSW